MVLTLQELLERIRPAGTPGAPSEGDRQRQREDRATEVADITAVLAEFDAEADAIVTAAQSDAHRLREQAKRQAGAIRADLADRVATAGAEIGAQDERLRNSQEETIRSKAELVEARLTDAADEAIPALVDAAMQVIWDSIPTRSETQR